MEYIMIGSYSSLTTTSHLVLPRLRVNRAQLQWLLLLRLVLSLFLCRFLSLSLAYFFFLVLGGEQIIEYLIEKILNIGTSLSRNLSIVLSLFLCDFLGSLSGF